jgi:hypothetical protein
VTTTQQQPTSHKRREVRYQQNFMPPRYGCWACRDTGIVQNSDGLVNRWLEDYDRRPDGQLMHGLDCALICTCDAAFPKLKPDGKLERGGFREESGDIRCVESDAGRRWVGVDPPLGMVGELNKIREESWQAMNRLTIPQRRQMVEAGLADLRAKAGGLFAVPSDPVRAMQQPAEAQP